jgi:hypothetical protein
VSARPCRGPEHYHEDPPIVSTPLCDKCRRKLVEVIQGIPEQYLEAYYALERGNRYDVRAEHEHGSRGKRAHPPLPLDAESDALMRNILTVVLCWHEVVVGEAGLSTQPTPRKVATKRTATRYELVQETSPYPSLEDETEGGTYAAVRAVQRAEAIDRPHDSTSGVALTSACTTLAAHVDTLLTLGPTPVVRAVPHRKVMARKQARRFVAPASGPAAVQNLGVPLLPDDTEGRVYADGRAEVIVEKDGVDAALELFALNREARRTLGVNRGATQFKQPCQACNEAALILRQGADHVECTACGDRIEAKDWRRLELIWGRSVHDVAEGM